MLKEILSEITPHGARLVAVSKTHPPERILELYERGQRIFGENRPQEMLEKHAALPADIQWHMIGHLQTNKVKYIAPFVSLIHSIDSLHLLQEVERQAQKQNRVIDVLLQFYIAREESKFGLNKAEAQALLESESYRNMRHIRICGVMGMASFTDDMELVRTEFRQLKQIFDELKQQFFPETPHFKEISMGMSGDWRIALEEGSTLLRIGTLLFGTR